MGRTIREAAIFIAGSRGSQGRGGEAQVYAADQLFATLDPTLRRINVADVGETVLADTVGFIRHLPHDLVAAFKATLQETRQATLLLHIIDAADVRVQENIDAVNTVLEEIEAHEIPTLLVDVTEDVIVRRFDPFGQLHQNVIFSDSAHFRT
jgi:GTP-binding protein HflX